MAIGTHHSRSRVHIVVMHPTRAANGIGRCVGMAIVAGIVFGFADDVDKHRTVAAKSRSIVG